MLIPPRYVIVSLIWHETLVVLSTYLPLVWKRFFNPNGSKSLKMSLLVEGFYVPVQVDAFLGVVAMVVMKISKFSIVNFTWIRSHLKGAIRFGSFRISMRILLCEAFSGVNCNLGCSASDLTHASTFRSFSSFRCCPS